MNNAAATVTGGAGKRPYYRMAEVRVGDDVWPVTVRPGVDPLDLGLGVSEAHGGADVVVDFEAVKRGVTDSQCVRRMKVEKRRRAGGFRVIWHDPYPRRDDGLRCRLLQESSSRESGHLWVGAHHRLNRDEVRELIAHMQRWLDTGSLAERDEQ